MIVLNIKFISLFYGLTFISGALILLRKTKRLVTPSSINVFWAFTAFLIMKALAILSTLSIQFLHTDDMLHVVIIKTLSAISSEISNLFLFHFGVSILTYKTSMRINYKIFPLLLFFAYAILNLTGIIEAQTSEKISRHSFAFSGAFLGGFGCFNLYKTRVTSSGEGWLSGPITCSIALLFYSFTEGAIVNPVLGIQVELLRLLSALVLLTVPFFIVELLEEEKGRRIGYV